MKIWVTETFKVCYPYGYYDIMTVIVRRERRKNGREYYKLYDVRRVGGKVVQKYVGYIGKNPKSKGEISYGDVLKYVERLMRMEITDSEIHGILKKLGMDADISPITKIVLENDRQLKKTFIRIR